MSTQAAKFVVGWRKLPDELKLQILRHVLPSGFTLSHHAFIDKRRMEDDHYPNFREDILPVLACPEIAALGIEQKLPPKPVRKLVRTWSAYITVEEIYSQRFQRVIDRLGDFPTAVEITLVVLGFLGSRLHSSTAATTDTIRQQLMAMEPLKFPTDKLSICYSVDGLVRLRLCDDLTDALQRCLTISGESKGIKQSCERRLFTYQGKEEDIASTTVAAWPEAIPEEHQREVRMTVWR